MKAKELERYKLLTQLYNDNLIDVSNNSFHITGEIDESVYLDTVKSLRYMNKERVITIYLNSEGGNLHDGLAIYDILNQLNTRIIVQGSAMSMAALILMAGKERLGTPNSVVMMHYGLTVEESESSAAMSKKLHNKIKDITKERCKTTSRKVNKWFKQDTYILATDCVKEGILDGVLDV